MFCWNQDQWEEIRKWRHDYWKEQMEARRELRNLKRKYKQELLKEKAEAKINKRKDTADKNVKVRHQKHEQRMERLKNWKKHWEKTIASVSTYSKHLSAFVATIMMVLIFLIIPYSNRLQHIAFSWFDAVKKLASSINFIPMDDDKRLFQAFANYIIFYILLIVAVLTIVFLCRYVYRILIRGGKGDKDQNSIERKNVLEEYDTAIAILTVFTAMLFALGTSDSSLSDIFNITNKWTTLLTAILLILIVFVSVEIVRLVVEQIGQKNSLLKRLVRLIFVSVLEFLAGLLLGVIINFKIEEVISSLLSMMFPQEELSFTSKVQEKFNEMFNKELDNDGNDGDDSLTLPRFSKKHIWRRYHEK